MNIFVLYDPTAPDNEEFDENDYDIFNFFIECDGKSFFLVNGMVHNTMYNRHLHGPRQKWPFEIIDGFKHYMIKSFLRGIE